jgi:carbonic anhydrase
MTGQEALAELVNGNQRFVNCESKHPHENPEWRQSLLSGQHPFAVIIGCSDSRVPVEIIFDQGLGDLFVIRVAGNVVNEDELGSVLYAVEHAGAPLVFVLGHECCGAITAAFATQKDRENEPAEIQRLLSCIDPAIKNIDPDLEFDEKVHQGAVENVKRMLNVLKKNSLMAKRIQEGALLIAGGVYELDSGAVRLLQ